MASRVEAFPYQTRPAEVKKQVSSEPMFREIGSVGLEQWGGSLHTEFLRELRGTQGVKTYREMSSNDAMIGAGLLVYVNLAKGVPFRVDSAEEGNPQADEVAEFVRGALFDDMSSSWRDTVGEIMTMLTYGWSWFEVVYKRREGVNADPTRRSKFTDGRIGWRKWAIRSQDSLERWSLDDNGGVQAMVQRAAPHFVSTPIPIEKSLLFRTSMDKGSPEGRSILRNAYTSWYQKRRMQVIRGIGIERDLAGLPVMTPPEGMDIWNPNDAQMVTLKTNAERIVRNIRRDENEGVVMPHGWELTLLSTAGSRQFDINATIAQLNAEMAMSMTTDFLVVGHEKVGAKSVAQDKRAVFALSASSYLDNVKEVVNRFAIPKLVELNGWPADLAPTLEHGPVAEIDLDALMTFVEKASNAGMLTPDEGLEDHLRERAQLPPRPEDMAMPVRQPDPNSIDEPSPSPGDTGEDDLGDVS